MRFPLSLYTRLRSNQIAKKHGSAGPGLLKASDVLLLVIQPPEILSRVQFRAVAEDAETMDFRVLDSGHGANTKWLPVMKSFTYFSRPFSLQKWHKREGGFWASELNDLLDRILLS